MGAVLNDNDGSSTRRTHVVRVGDIAPTQDNPNPTQSNYLDIEVLDAISFRNNRGEEMILNFVAENVVPYIIDDTGHNNGKTPDATEATRRTHMATVTAKDGTTYFDQEILDCIAFRDQNGEEWILDFQPTSNPDDPTDTSGEFNSTTGAGDANATRRVHDEKVSSPYGQTDPTTYINVTRCDNIAFRNVRGEQMIVSCPSNDDPNNSDPRAATHVWSPAGGYDPSDDSIVPPTNTDPDLYAFLPPGASFMSQDARVAMGPLWWIRKVSGGDIIVVQIDLRTQGFIPPGSSGSEVGGGGDEEGPDAFLSGISVTSDFGLSAPSVDASLPIPAMPRNQEDITNGIVPAINLSDGAWQTIFQFNTGNQPTSPNWSYTVLLFLNPSQIETPDNQNTTEIILGIPKLHLNFANPVAGIGYYIWAVSGGTVNDAFASTFTPTVETGFPFPDASNAFDPLSVVNPSVYPDAPGSYVGVWNNNFTLTKFPLTGFQPTADMFSTAFRIGGFASQAAADTYASALNAEQAAGIVASGIILQADLDTAEAELAQVIADNFANPFILPVYEKAVSDAEARLAANGSSPPPIVFQGFSIPFDDGASPGPQPEIDLTITMANFSGKTTFDYDANNQPKFTYPTDPGDFTKYIQKKFGYLPALTHVIEGEADPSDFPGTTITLHRAPAAGGKKVFSIVDTGPLP